MKKVTKFLFGIKCINVVYTTSELVLLCLFWLGKMMGVLLFLLTIYALCRSTWTDDLKIFTSLAVLGSIAEFYIGDNLIHTIQIEALKRIIKSPNI